MYSLEEEVWSLVRWSRIFGGRTFLGLDFLYFYLKKEVEHLLVSPLLSPRTCLLEVEKRGREQHGGVKQHGGVD